MGLREPICVGFVHIKHRAVHDIAPSKEVYSIDESFLDYE